MNGPHRFWVQASRHPVPGDALDRLQLAAYIFFNRDQLMSKFERVQATVSGVVQGVGFRYFVVRAAARNDITGWVRNLPNGSVEIVAEGESGMLRELMRELKAGPQSAHVTGVAVRSEVYKAEFSQFEVRS